MFVPTHPLIVSRLLSTWGCNGAYTLFDSNGHYVYHPGLGRVRKETKRDKKYLYYRCETDQGTYWGMITDKLIVERIKEYMALYWGKKHVNCSAFAHFLTTGEFIECDPAKHLLVIEQGMRAYKGQKIHVGDMLCVVYADQKSCSSRKTSWRSGYKRAQKKRHNDGTFKHGLFPPKLSCTADEVRTYCLSSSADDFHFLVCVGKYNDEPVWVSQRGHFHPSDDLTIPLVLTVGPYDGYPNDVPLVTFIKKRR